MKALFQSMVSKLTKKPVLADMHQAVPIEQAQFISLQTIEPIRPVDIVKPTEIITEKKTTHTQIPQILTSGGPQVTLVSRGNILYASCPECSSTWNVRERLLRRHLLRADNQKALTCPACDKAVCLPATVDLRKLS